MEEWVRSRTRWRRRRRERERGFLQEGLQGATDCALCCFSLSRLSYFVFNGFNIGALVPLDGSSLTLRRWWRMTKTYRWPYIYMQIKHDLSSEGVYLRLAVKRVRHGANKSQRVTALNSSQRSVWYLQDCRKNSSSGQSRMWRKQIINKKGKTFSPPRN